MDLFRDTKDDGGVGMAYLTAGSATLLAGDAVLALSYLRSALEVIVTLEAVHSTCLGLDGAAAALAGLGEPASAARLFGGAATRATALGYDLYLDEEVRQRLRDAAEAEARAALGEEAFLAEWAQGEAMTLAELVDLVTAEADRYAPAD